MAKITKITKEEFKEAKLFIRSDIEREMQLAKVSTGIFGKQILRWLKIHPGGGNFLAALGLLCYTEFAGKLVHEILNGQPPPPKWANKIYFGCFLDSMGQGYLDFRKKEDVYGRFRCGMAHSYHVGPKGALLRKDFAIYMQNNKKQIGIGKENGIYFFVVEKYFEDFMKAFTQLEQELATRGWK